MKKVLLISIFALLVVFGVTSSFAFITKGDTLVIEQADADAVPLNEIIAADTTASGERVHAVYELVPDGWYSLSATLNASTYDLTLIGGKRTSTIQSRPIILAKLDFSGWQMMTVAKNFTMEGIHFMQVAETSGGNIGSWARAGISLGDVDQKVVLHDIIWDFNTGFQLYGAKDGLNLSVTNCLTRFSGSRTNTRWDGQGFAINGADLDSVVFRNCTWFGGHSFFLSHGEGTTNHFEMDHCTIADYTNYPIWGFYWQNATFSNNLFYNAFTSGEDETARVGQDPDYLPYGVVCVDTIYVDSLGTVNQTREAARNLLLTHNNNFVSQNIKDYWYEAMADTSYGGFLVADPEYYDGFLNSRSRAMFEDDATWPGLVLESMTSLDPTFTNVTDYSDSLILYSKCLWLEDDAYKTQLFTDPDGDPLIPTDPMEFDLSYSNAELLTASTTGGPIGDLTWFLEDGYNTTSMETLSAVKTRTKNVSGFTLQQNYPNPFNPATTIEYTLAQSGLVNIQIFNTLGQTVKTLVNGYKTSGTYSLVVDANDLTSGVYFYSIRTADFNQTRKMMLVK